jgi:hypothetical protein
MEYNALRCLPQEAILTCVHQITKLVRTLRMKYKSTQFLPKNEHNE